MNVPATPRLRLLCGEQHDAPAVPYGTAGYNVRPWLPEHGIFALVDAAAQYGHGLTIVGCDHYGLSVELDGHRFMVSSGTQAQQSVAEEAYGARGGLWVWDLSRVEWGGGIAGGNVHATKDCCVTCDPRAMIHRFVQVMRRLIAAAKEG